MYLEVNQTIEETVNLIKDRIRTNTPLAISRYGDGEIYFLNRNSPPEHQQRGCNDWGYNYPNDVNQFYDDAGRILINGIQNSDVIDRGLCADAAAFRPARRGGGRYG